MDGENDFAAAVIKRAFDATAAAGSGLTECYIAAVDAWAAIFPEHSRMRAERRAISLVQSTIRPEASPAHRWQNDDEPVHEID
jgi:hypothetical protein